MISFKNFFPGFKILKTEIEENIIIELISKQKYSCCPICGTKSTKIHSRYTRNIADTSILSKHVNLKVVVNKYFCRNSNCDRKIFSESFNNFIEPYSRVTDRLKSLLTGLAFNISSEKASKLSHLFCKKISGDTFLRLIMNNKTDIKSNYKVLGIDDWAFRKGKSYGTLICDLETNKPVDLLPDRTTFTLSEWLKNHKSVEIVTRDRANAYSKAIKLTIPDAVQIADKWNLLKNATNVLKDIMQSKYIKGFYLKEDVKNEIKKNLNIKNTESENKKIEIQQQKMKIVEETKKLKAKGYSYSDITEALGISKKTIIRYLRRIVPPNSSYTYRGSILDEHKSTINKEFKNGTKSLEIYDIIVKEGFKGSTSTLRMYLSQLKKYLKINESMETAEVTVKTKLVKRAKLQKILWKKYDKLKDKDKHILDEILKNSKDISHIYQALQSFRGIVKSNSIDSLGNWISCFQDSNIINIRKFVIGIKNDIDAVRNSISYNYTNDLLEGQVNRLKTIKRLLYGRAGFELLRKRVLYQG